MNKPGTKQVWPWIITYRDQLDDPVLPPRKAWIEAESAEEAKIKFKTSYAGGNPRRKCIIYEVIR